MTDQRFALAVGISVLSGAVRGFSGFGSALVYVPLMSALYGPQAGAATFLLIDFATGIVFSIGVWRQAVWREVVPLVVAAVFAAQFGTLILHYADPVWLRWLMVGMVLAVVVVLGSGWRYHGRPLLVITILVGLAAGAFGGAMMGVGKAIDNPQGEVTFWVGVGTLGVGVVSTAISLVVLSVAGIEYATGRTVQNE